MTLKLPLYRLALNNEMQVFNLLLNSNLGIAGILFITYVFDSLILS